MIHSYAGCRNKSKTPNNSKKTPLRSYDSLAVKNVVYEDQYLAIDSLDEWYKMDYFLLLSLKVLYHPPTEKNINIVYALTPDQTDSIDLPFILIQNEKYKSELEEYSFDKLTKEFEVRFSKLMHSNRYKNEEIDFHIDRERGLISITAKSENKLFSEATQISYVLFHQKGSTSLILVTDNIQSDIKKLDELLDNTYFKYPINN